jgi:hypothetical protein
MELVEGDLAERDVDPDVVVISREGIPKRIARRFGITRLPELDTLLVIELCLQGATRIRKLKVFAVDPGEADRSPTSSQPGRIGPSPTSGPGRALARRKSTPSSSVRRPAAVTLSLF